VTDLQPRSHGALSFQQGALRSHSHTESILSTRSHCFVRSRARAPHGFMRSSPVLTPSSTYFFSSHSSLLRMRPPLVAVVLHTSLPYPPMVAAHAGCFLHAQGCSIPFTLSCSFTYQSPCSGSGVFQLYPLTHSVPCAQYLWSLPSESITSLHMIYLLALPIPILHPPNPHLTLPVTQRILHLPLPVTQRMLHTFRTLCALQTTSCA